MKHSDQRSLDFQPASDVYLQAGDWRVDQGDAVDWLSRFPDESVDLIVTDPAYESLEKHRAKGTTTRLKVSKSSSNEWFPIFPNARFPEFFRECYRVLRKDRHFYVYCDQETMFVAKPIAEAAGFRFWKPLVWWKKQIGMGYHYRNTYEFILFFEKGKLKLNDLGQSDVIAEERVRDGYPTQKPVRVSEVLVRQSTTPGDLVVDPFVGSGSVGVAALARGCAFLGCDIKEGAVELARRTLANAANPQNVRPPGNCTCADEPERRPDCPKHGEAR